MLNDDPVYGTPLNKQFLDIANDFSLENKPTLLVERLS